ncbi:MAG: DUF6134 family protein [Rhodospirillaceae bacterium]
MRTAYLLFATLVAAGREATALERPDPIALYGDQIAFDVERNGTPIGRHIVHFEQTEAGLKSRSDVEMAVDVLFFRAFSYRYQADAVWREGGLDRLTVDINDNGQRSYLTAQRAGEKLWVSRDGRVFEAAAGLYPSEHWDAGVVKQQRVLNTLTGKINHVAIQPEGRDPVETERGTIAATRYRYTGDLDAEVWYDDAGRWVKLRFKGRDGSTIAYRCRSCQGGAPRT